MTTMTMYGIERECVPVFTIQNGLPAMYACVCLTVCLLFPNIHLRCREGWKYNGAHAIDVTYTHSLNGWCVKFYPSTQQCVANYTGISTRRGAFLISTFSLHKTYFVVVVVVFVVVSFLKTTKKKSTKNLVRSSLLF